MKFVSIEDAQNSLQALAQEVEAGETVIVTRDGHPICKMVAHKRRGGIDLAAGQAYLAAQGITNPVPYIAEDFDDPLPEDFLLRPLPGE